MPKKFLVTLLVCYRSLAPAPPRNSIGGAGLRSRPQGAQTHVELVRSSRHGTAYKGTTLCASAHQHRQSPADKIAARDGPHAIERMASLGWNTESTLLPKKAKKIAAPNTSMGALKDEVFAASMTAAAAGGKGKYARGTASRRRTDADDLDSAGRKRPRRREARRARDEGDEDDRAAASRRKLEAKARLYDDLRRGEARAPAEFLVTFDDAGAAPAPVRVAEQESGGTRWAWGRGEAEAPRP